MQPNRPEVPIVDSNNIYEVDFQGLKELSNGVTMKICAAVINTDGKGRRVIVALSSEYSRHVDSLGSGLLLAGLNGFTDKRVVSVGGGKL